MSRFNTKKDNAVPEKASETGTNHAGGVGFVRDPRRELLQLAVVNMVGQDTFYESAGDRDNRFRNMVRSVAKDDPEWMLDFLRWLRDGANMRTASLVAACEAVHARLEWYQDPTLQAYRFPREIWNRQFIEVVCQRADEPAELMAYWFSRFGKRLPKPVKRGVADAARRMYSERNFLKYDSSGADIRMADVLELTHPEPDPSKPWQGDLFKHIIDDRQGRGAASPPKLKMITQRNLLTSMEKQQRRTLLQVPGGAQALADGGMTWESVAGWLQGPMDAKAWEAIIPSMGVMALVRNLKNFDEAGVSDKVAMEHVMPKLMDEKTVRLSKMFPYRMLSAERMMESRRWSGALDVALGHACKNVPAMDGRTLVLVDTSASMRNPVSMKSKVRHIDVGALFAVAMSVAGNEVDLYGFADGFFKHEINRKRSVLEQTEAFVQRVGEVGHGTETIQALVKIYDKVGEDHYKRVVIVTDMQAFSYGGSAGAWYNRPSGIVAHMPRSVSEAVPAKVPLIGVDTTGYQKSAIDASKPNRYEVGGFSDAMFKMVAMLTEDRRVSAWPWS